MRVLIDAHMIGEHETGNETYIVNLLSGLSQLDEVTCGAVVRPGINLPAVLQNARIEYIPLRPAGNWSRLFYTLPLLCRRWKADILHTTYIGPFFSPCARVCSVHDISFKRYPEYFSPRDRLLFATLLPLTLRQVDGVITLSQHAKSEIIEFFPYLKDRIYVTLGSASSNLFRPVCDARRFDNVRVRYCIHSDFILAVGNLQPRKNLKRLIEAFNRVHYQYPSLQLVIVGKAQWQASEIFTMVTELGLTDQVVFTGYVPDEDLVSLYNMAKVFVYPSLYEGFGLPILEAMACGTPVITSNRSSMLEIAGEVAILIDPCSVEQIASTTEQVLNDPLLRAELKRQGLQQAACFSWRRTAQETLQVYRKVLGARPKNRESGKDTVNG